MNTRGRTFRIFFCVPSLRDNGGLSLAPLASPLGTMRAVNSVMCYTWPDISSLIGFPRILKLLLICQIIWRQLTYHSIHNNDTKKKYCGEASLPRYMDWLKPSVCLPGSSIEWARAPEVETQHVCAALDHSQSKYGRKIQ